jgi:septum formation protein
MPHFILASSSPRRRALFTTFGIPFTIHKPEIDESQHPGEAPLTYVQRLSRQKAARIAQLQTVSSVVLAADTVVIVGADTLGITEEGEILGKPVDAADAYAMLSRLRGRTHQVCTALTLHHLTDAEPVIHTLLTCTEVLMRPYSAAEIEAYIATGDPFDKAGSYAIQHPVFRPVAQVTGCYTNVVGLPMCTLHNALVSQGWLAGSPVAPAPGCGCGDHYSSLLT